MISENVLSEIRKISQVVRGRGVISQNSDKFEEDINELISSVSFEGFFATSSNECKAAFLAISNKENFTSLSRSLKEFDCRNIFHAASIGEVRDILVRLLSIPELTDFIFNEKYSSSKITLEQDKEILIEGFLKKISEEEKKSTINNLNIKDIIKEKDKLFAEYEILRKEHERIVGEYEQKLLKLEEKNAEIIQNRIDLNLSTYVSKSVAALEIIEKKLKSAAARWSFLSVFILFSGFAAGIGFALFGYVFGPDIKELKWPELLIFSIKGVFLVSAFVAAAGYSFMKSNAFTHEAIIVSNRAHAIQFGKLYLEIYGNTVERSEMQKIFENWNISSDTAFLKHKTDKSESVKFDALLDSLKKVKELIPSIGKE